MVILEGHCVVEEGRILRNALLACADLCERLVIDADTSPTIRNESQLVLAIIQTAMVVPKR